MAASDTREIAFEDAIERALTGQVSRPSTPTTVTADTDVMSDVLPQGAPALRPFTLQPQDGSPFTPGRNTDFDADRGFDPQQLLAFLEASQADELARLQRDPHGEDKLLQRLHTKIKQRGLLHVLRNGIQHDDFDFRLFYELPGAVAGVEARHNYLHNRWSLTRQVYFEPGSRASVDVVVFVNGLPLATIELKTVAKQQTARVNGINQYKGRPTTAALFAFRHCLVHLAVDTEEVWMTTHLRGKATVFLPFNRGNGGRAGNPVNPNGHRTAYLWEDVLQPASLARIVSDFAFQVDKKADPRRGTPAVHQLFFPRYHQREVVRQLVGHAGRHGAGQRYLIQHSAGSGKSNSIMWLAYQLIEVYPVGDEAAARPGYHRPLFDSVIVVTDRRLLDQQIRETIQGAQQVGGIVRWSTDSAELRDAMEGGTRVIITTIQKFPFVLDQIGDMSNRTFAIVIDEAHSSQSGSAHDKMNAALGSAANGADADPDDPDAVDGQDLVLAAMRARKRATNASYFAFTATPKAITLEKFGVRQPDGSFAPFHLYSMRQAIEEGFILDVLANYTTYRSYYEVAKSIEDNPDFEVASAQRRLRRHVEEHPQTIAAKAEIMVEHFLDRVVRPRRLRGQGRCMIVTKNITAAIRYYQAVGQVLRKRNSAVRALVAFSDKKVVDGIEHTEASLNGPGVGDIREAFDTDPYRILVVANKFLTGFDQPKLCAMYVDKPLAGVQAVQALSRLNRAAGALGKKTEDLFVLDFVNTVEDVKAAFDPFYTATSLSEATDLNVLHDLIDYLEPVGVYLPDEVRAFAKTYFAGADAQALSPLLDAAVDRFEHTLNLTDQDQKDFKVKARQFVKIYGQLASVTELEVPAWEELYWYLKFLVPKLRIDHAAAGIDDLLESVDLNTYGLERSRVQAKIELDADADALDPANPNPRSVHDDGGRDALDNIIAAFNEAHFSAWEATAEAKRARVVNVMDQFRRDPRYATQYQATSDPSNKRRVKEDMLEEAVQQTREEDMQFQKLWAMDPGFKATFIRAIDQALEERRGELPL